MKKVFLRINVAVLFLAALMDINRGIAHTYRVKQSAVEFAGIEPISDSLVIMGAFGMSNFLTGFIYALIAWKAKKPAPYILFIIPISYFIGTIGLMKVSGVALESRFFGRYILAVYFTICLITSLSYFFVRAFQNRKAAYS